MVDKRRYIKNKNLKAWILLRFLSVYFLLYVKTELVKFFKSMIKLVIQIICIQSAYIPNIMIDETVLNKVKTGINNTSFRKQDILFDKINIGLRLISQKLKIYFRSSIMYVKLY